MLTNICRLACVLSLFVLGCGDNSETMSAPDMTATAADMAHATGDMAQSSGGDGGSLLALCAICVNNSDCATGVCATYGMGANQSKKCSHSCATASAAQDCPGVNACNGMAMCKCM